MGELVVGAAIAAHTLSNVLQGASFGNEKADTGDDIEMCEMSEGITPAAAPASAKAK